MTTYTIERTEFDADEWDNEQREIVRYSVKSGDKEYVLSQKDPFGFFEFATKGKAGVLPLSLRGSFTTKRDAENALKAALGKK